MRKIISLVLLFVITACTTHVINPTSQSIVELVETVQLTTAPPTLSMDEQIPEQTDDVNIPMPVPMTDADRQHAIKMLEPKFNDLPFYDQALDTYSIHREYYGCVDNTDVGGVLTYYVSKKADEIVSQFGKFLSEYSIDASGWKEIKNTSFLGRAIKLSGSHSPDRNLPVFMTFDVGIYDHSEIEDQENDNSPLSAIWVTVNVIDNTENYVDEENRTAAFVNNCPNGKWWLMINPNLVNP